MNAALRFALAASAVLHSAASAQLAEIPFDAPPYRVYWNARADSAELDSIATLLLVGLGLHARRGARKR
jgi:hypothetical protein